MQFVFDWTIIEMYAYNFSTQAVEEQINFYEITFEESKLDEAKPSQVIAFNEGMSFFFIIYTFGWLFFLVSALIRGKVAQKARATTLRNHKQISCHNCRFFSSNPYLKCALHPSIALTKQAENCSDYYM